MEQPDRLEDRSDSASSGSKAITGTHRPGGMRSRVIDAVESLRDEMFGATAELVRIPSVIGSEGLAQAYVAEKYRELGLDVDIFEPAVEELSGHPAYVSVPWGYTGRPNVVGTMRGRRGTRSLILNGHVDVVSPEPVDSWTRDPWGGEIVDGRMYGRGASDMKSGLMASYFALKSILKAGLRPRGTVILESVIEEEMGGSGGTLACRLRGHLADGAVVTEPMELRLFLAHAGVYLFRVLVEGMSRHAVFSHEGVNAIGKATRIYQALVDLDARRAAQHRFSLLEDASGRSCNLNVGSLRAGDWPGTVPGFAVMEGRVGFIPGEKGDDVKKEVEQTVQAACEGDSWLEEHPPRVEWFGMHTEPWYQDPSHPLARTLQSSVMRATGAPAEIGGGRGSLDNRLYSYFNIPSVCYGAKGGNGHGVDEWADLDSVVTTAKVVALTIMDWCGWART